jgi:nucleotide-binding universal stress UspA family protein
MNKILVPTDFSVPADYALDVAMHIAPKLHAEVHIIHRLYVYPGWEKLSPVARKAFPESEANLNELKEKYKALRKKYEDQSVRIVTTYGTGDIVPLISNYIDAEKIYMIIMGSSGAGGLKEFMFGSNAQKIVRHAHCPVMVVKHPVEKPEFKTLVFASDFDKKAEEPFKRLLDFGRHFGSHIHLLNIAAYPKFDVTEEDLKRMKEFEKLSWMLPCTSHGMGDIDIELGITHFANKTKADMVTIAHYGKEPLMRVFTGSVTESLVNHLELPVMTVNTKDLRTWKIVHEEDDDPAALKYAYNI